MYTMKIHDVKAARKAYAEHEPRDLFYRAATTLIDLARNEKGPLNLAESLAVLLQTWNMAYYRYHPFTNAHLADLESVLAALQPALDAFRPRSIEGFSAAIDEVVVKKVFNDIEQVLGPVGAAKCLHLLAPAFFPLWDRAIARAYRLSLHRRGWNAERYFRFMEMTREQVKALGGKRRLGPNPLKAIDECNYCKAQGWI
jgi:hypothetical protein